VRSGSRRQRSPAQVVPGVCEMRLFKAGHRTTVVDPPSEIGLLHGRIVPRPRTAGPSQAARTYRPDPQLGAVGSVLETSAWRRPSRTSPTPRKVSSVRFLDEPSALQRGLVVVGALVGPFRSFTFFPGAFLCGIRRRSCAMQFRRARRLSSDGTMYHGACSVSVASSMRHGPASSRTISPATAGPSGSASTVAAGP